MTFHHRLCRDALRRCTGSEEGMSMALRGAPFRIELNSPECVVTPTLPILKSGDSQDYVESEGH